MTILPSDQKVEEHLNLYFGNESTPIPFQQSSQISDLTPDRLSQNHFFFFQNQFNHNFYDTPYEKKLRDTINQSVDNGTDKGVVTSSKLKHLENYSTPSTYDTARESDLSPKTVDKIFKSDAAVELFKLLVSHPYSNSESPSTEQSDLPGLLKPFCYSSDIKSLLNDNFFSSETSKDDLQQNLSREKLSKNERESVSKMNDLINLSPDKNSITDVWSDTNQISCFNKFQTFSPRKSIGEIQFFNPDHSLNLDVFRTLPCPKATLIHNCKNCFYYHSQRDRRRHYSLYRAEQCEDHFDFDDDYTCICRNGDNCSKCHNRHELLYHPSIYKQRFCSSYNLKIDSAIQCHRGQLCAFAHSRKEIRSQLFSNRIEKKPDANFFMMEFKTFWCPYGLQHDWHECLYAHTYQDCRRSPVIGYGSEPCPYWKKDLHCENYQKRCVYGTKCPYSHGSKEQLYHPAYYKTMPCADYKAKGMCPRKTLCAFYHELSEKRTVTTTQINHYVTSVSTKPLDETQNLQDDAIKNLEFTYDYSKPLCLTSVTDLQKNFMCPPLFNLDDFEAFGHTSAKQSYPSELSKLKGKKFVESGSRIMQLGPMMPFYPSHASNRDSIINAQQNRNPYFRKFEQSMQLNSDHTSIY